MKNAYHKIHTLLTGRGLKPSVHILDNECPNVLKYFMREVNEKFQLVPPRTYHRNPAERAIQNFKENFIAEFASTQTELPLHLWCRIIPHASLKPNLLCQSQMNPKLSGYTNYMENSTIMPLLWSLPVHKKCTYQTNSEKKLGSKWGERMVYWSFHGAL